MVEGGLTWPRRDKGWWGGGGGGGIGEIVEAGGFNPLSQQEQ